MDYAKNRIPLIVGGVGIAGYFLYSVLSGSSSSTTSATPTDIGANQAAVTTAGIQAQTAAIQAQAQVQAAQIQANAQTQQVGIIAQGAAYSNLNNAQTQSYMYAQASNQAIVGSVSTAINSSFNAYEQAMANGIVAMAGAVGTVAQSNAASAAAAGKTIASIAMAFA